MSVSFIAKSWLEVRRRDFICVPSSLTHGDSSGSIITRQSPLTHTQKYLLRSQPVDARSSWSCWDYLKTLFPLSAQTVNGVIGWNDSGVWATDSDWQVLIMSEVESCRDVASAAIGVRLLVFLSKDFPCVHLHMHAYCRLCSLCHNYKSLWNPVFLPNDPSSLQLAWPQGYAALSFSGALHSWQL